MTGRAIALTTLRCCVDSWNPPGADRTSFGLVLRPRPDNCLRAEAPTGLNRVKPIDQRSSSGTGEQQH
jgi:hypothetical protein